MSTCACNKIQICLLKATIEVVVAVVWRRRTTTWEREKWEKGENECCGRGNYVNVHPNVFCSFFFFFSYIDSMLMTMNGCREYRKRSIRRMQYEILFLSRFTFNLEMQRKRKKIQFWKKNAMITTRKNVESNRKKKNGIGNNQNIVYSFISLAFTFLFFLLVFMFCC